MMQLCTVQNSHFRKTDVKLNLLKFFSEEQTIVPKPYPGVMPYSEYSNGGVKTTHALMYKWVSIILIIQGLLFVFPRLIWRRYETEITSLFKGTIIKS